MRILKWIGVAVLALVLTAGGLVAWNLLAKPFSLRLLADRQTIAALFNQPETLTAIGAIDGTLFDRHSGKLDEITVSQRDTVYAQMRKYRSEIENYADPAKLDRQDQLTYAVLRSFYDSTLSLEKYPYLGVRGTIYAVDQFWAQPTSFVTFMQNLNSVRNEKLARSYVARLEAATTQIDQMTAEVRRQADFGVVLPAYLIDKTIQIITDFTQSSAKENALYVDYAKKLAALEGLSSQEREALEARAAAAIETGIYPAYGRLVETFQSVKARATNDVGVWTLPDGAAIYAALVKNETTTDYTPAQIHELGLSEVARIEQEMDAILRAEGLTQGSIGERMRILAKRPDQLFPDSDAGRAQILARYVEIHDRIMRDIVPKTFSTVPPQPMEVRRMQPFEELGAPLAYYNPAALDGSRPGVFYVNLSDVSAVPRFSMATLVAHEGSPGHHFQLSTAQGLKDLPFIRQVLPFTAYAEGWALYGERLVAEEGFYANDRLSDLGRLRDEMFRSVRLVVDTGIHDKRWSREQAIAYMIDKTGMADGEVTNEIDRYITGPGQALAYKVGQLKILELREMAKAALGDRFDLKSFHALILGYGAMPLTVLEDQVDDYIKRRSAA